jgi:hypothetical protein
MKLNLTGCSLITDEAIRMLSYSRSAVKLQQLNFSDCHELTDKSANYIGRSLKQLHAINVKNCIHWTGKYII